MCIYDRISMLFSVILLCFSYHSQTFDLLFKVGIFIFSVEHEETISKEFGIYKKCLLR